MPITFTIAVVEDRLKGFDLSLEGCEKKKRERLAEYVENKYGDHVEAWEIRTGRPWDAMTREEAKELVDANPVLLNNPGILSRLLQ